MNNLSDRMIAMLEDVRTALTVSSDGPGTQSKPLQTNSASAAAAKSKVDALNKKSQAGRTSATRINAAGAKRK